MTTTDKVNRLEKRVACYGNHRHQATATPRQLFSDHNPTQPTPTQSYELLLDTLDF